MFRYLMGGKVARKSEVAVQKKDEQIGRAHV
jgi:hypothetical protein